MFTSSSAVTADAIFAKWDGWLSTIHGEIQGLLVNRHIFREVQAIIQANPKIQLASSFYQWMGNTYATAAVIGVRRQLDKDPDSVSFARLLGEVATNPQVLSRERYVALYKKYARKSRPRETEFPVGRGKRAPKYSRRIENGSILLFYAGTKFKIPGVYAVAVALDAVQSPRRGDRGYWNVSVRRLPYSKRLAITPFRGNPMEFAPPAEATTLLQIKQPSKRVRDLIQRALRLREGQRPSSVRSRAAVVTLVASARPSSRDATEDR